VFNIEILGLVTASKNFKKNNAMCFLLKFQIFPMRPQARHYGKTKCIHLIIYVYGITEKICSLNQKKLEQKRSLSAYFSKLIIQLFSIKSSTQLVKSP